MRRQFVKVIRSATFKAAAVAGSMAGTGMAMAAGDGGAVAALTEAGTTAAAVATAALAVVVGIKVFKYIRAAL